ncbi:MAG: autoinducer binding domain-containing protein [Thermodesulfobacteriota bacterium]
MNTKDYTKSELTGLLEAVDLSSQSSSEGDLRALIIRAKELVGADYSICAMGTVASNGLSDVLTVVNGDYPEEWVRIYKSEGLHNADPVVRHHARFCGTQLWADTYRRYTDSEAKRFFSRAGDFGLNYGISSGVYVPGAEMVSIFSFAGSRNIFDAHNKEIVDILTLHLHKAFEKSYRMNLRPEVTAPTMYAERH